MKKYYKSTCNEARKWLPVLVYKFRDLLIPIGLEPKCKQIRWLVENEIHPCSSHTFLLYSIVWQGLYIAELTFPSFHNK
jgi:hypothetical protein